MTRTALFSNRRTVIANTVLLLAMLTVVLASLAMGTLHIPPDQVVHALLGQGDPLTRMVVHDLRLQRSIAGLASGAALAVAGCVMQSLARNRLATPGIIGIDNAATAFAVASVVGTGIALAPSTMALVGAATATALAFGLAGANGTRGYRFIIAGLGIGAIAGAITQLMLSQVAIDDANAAYPWTVGSLNSRDRTSILILSAGLLTGYLCLQALARSLNALQFSDPVAVALGIRLRTLRVIGLSLSVLLTGCAVAVCGPVGLIALIAPELARTVCRPGRMPITASALAGATLMLAADTIGRTLFSPLEVPVGVITAILGSPYLLWILLRPANRSLR